MFRHYVRESKPGSVMKSPGLQGLIKAFRLPLAPLLFTEASSQVTLATGNVTALPLVYSRTLVSQESKVETQRATAKQNHAKKIIGKGSTEDESPSPSNAMS